jgi:long-chain acyl-CoA synthetase
LTLGSWGAGFLRRLRGGRAPAAAEGPTEVDETPFPWESVYPEGLHWRVHIRPQPLWSILDEAVRTYPNRPCIDFLGRSYSYAEIGALTNRAALGLMRLGIKKGSRVGLLMPNCPYYVVCYFAVLKLGATVVNYNPLYSVSQIVQQMRDSGTELMVTTDGQAFYGKVAKGFGESPLEKVVVCSLRKALPFAEGVRYSFLNLRRMSTIPDDGRHSTFEQLTETEGDLPAVEVDPRQDIAVLQYTGGSTGLSKAAMLTHANLFCNAVQTEIWAIGTEYGKERILAALPFSHAFGMSAVMNVGIVLGAELVVLPRFKVEDALAAIERAKPTIFIGVPSMFSAIAFHPGLARFDLSSLRLCIGGGAPLPARVQKAIEAVAPCKLVEGYGLTEAGPIVTANPFKGENRLGSVGLPLPGTVVEILDVKDRKTPVPRGVRGEVCVTGPQVMPGYLARPEENAVTLAGGRLHTGDVGYLDAQGYLYIVDRLKKLILTGGFNVHPGVVEEVIRRHAAVREVQVVGVPDDIMGEIVKAVVTLQPGADAGADDIREFLADKLATFEIPKIFEFTDDRAAQGSGPAMSAVAASRSA